MLEYLPGMPCRKIAEEEIVKRIRLAAEYNIAALQQPADKANKELPLVIKLTAVFLY
jgi:hypothetical protein